MVPKVFTFYLNFFTTGTFMQQVHYKYFCIKKNIIIAIKPQLCLTLAWVPKSQEQTLNGQKKKHLIHLGEKKYLVSNSQSLKIGNNMFFAANQYSNGDF